MRGARVSGLALAVLLALGARALADDDDLVDFDDQQERSDSFWARVSHPNHGRWRALVDEARKALEENEPRRALGLLDEAVKLEPGEAEGHYFRGLTLNTLERWSECASEYDRVLKLQPGFKAPPRPGLHGPGMPFEFDVGVCLALGGRLEESLPYYQKMLASGQITGPALAMVLWNVGDSYQALGRLEEAIDAYRDGIEAQPAHAMLRMALGVAYDRDGQVALAVDAIQEALGIDPTSSMTAPDGHRALFVPREDEDYYRGLAHKVARRRTAAIVYFRSYLASSKTSPWASRAREHLGQLGAATLGDVDVDVKGIAPELRGPWQRPVVQAAPDLQRCLEGKPLSRIVLEIGLPSTSAPRAEPAADKKDRAKDRTKKVKERPAPAVKVNPGVAVRPEGPATADDATAVECVRKRAERIKLPRPRDSALVVSVGVIGK